MDASATKRPNPKKSPADRRKRPAAEAPFAIPSILTEKQRDQEETRLVANMLAGIGQEEVRLDTLRLVNEQEETDVVPGEAQTYAEARKRLAENKQKILDTVGEDRVKKAIELLQSGD